MPKRKRGKREKSDRWGCADIFSLSGQAAAEEDEEGDCGPIAAGLCPELLAVCRRGCRPERDTPPPPNTRSA